MTTNPRRILLPGWKVDAIRKGATQLRVAIKPQPPADAYIDARSHCGNEVCFCSKDKGPIKSPWRCPYPVGSRLWVPETFDVLADPAIEVSPVGQYKDDGLGRIAIVVDYRADNPTRMMDRPHPRTGKVLRKWHAPAVMPYRASRILIEVTDVRCQQVQEISDSDIHAEGLDEPLTSATWPEKRRVWFQNRWDSAYPKPEESFSAKPWVWALTFETLEGPA